MRKLMLPGILLMLIAISVSARDAGISSLPCEETESLPVLDIAEETKTVPVSSTSLQSLKFRTSKDFHLYNLTGLPSGIPLLSIEPHDTRQLPDSVKWGDGIIGLHTFYRTYITTQPQWVHSIRTDRNSLELWNVYIRRENAEEENSSISLLSLNIPFNISNQSHSRLAPLVLAAKKLASNGSPVTLPYNYDLYALMPRESRFIIYDTNAYPFPFPLELGTETVAQEQGCKRRPLVKVLIFSQPIDISEADLYEIQNAIRSVLRTPRSVDHEVQHVNDLSEEASKVTAYLTPIVKVIARNRRVARAAALMLPFRTWNGEAEQPPYPPDCRFLHHILKLPR